MLLARRFLFVVFALLLPVAGVVAGESTRPQGEDIGAFAGVWELDPEQSDDPAELMARAAERAEERGRGRRGAGRGGRGGMGGGMRGGGPPGGMAGGMDGSWGGLPDPLEIETGAGELRLLLDDRVQILYLDGEEHAREDGRGARITSEAEVRGGIVRVSETRRLPFGEFRVFRTLEVTEEGEVLVVRTEINLPRGDDPLLLRSVYRRLP